METSGHVGIITGALPPDGQAPQNGTMVRTGQEDGIGYTDNTGRFRLIALAGPGTGTINLCLADLPFTAVAGQTVAIETGNRDTGNFNVRFRSQAGPFRVDFSCYFNSATGSRPVAATPHPVPVTISAGQTTIINVETS